LKTSGSIRHPELKEKIHCVAMVVDADQVKNIKYETKKRLLDVKGMCVTKGMFSIREEIITIQYVTRFY